MSTKAEQAKREQQLYAVAEQLLIDGGVSEFRLDQLSASLGVAKGTLYRHFVSKDALFLELMQRYEQDLSASLQNVGTPKLRLRAYFEKRLTEAQRSHRYHQLEEILSNSEASKRLSFKTLYTIRRERLRAQIALSLEYLSECESSMSEREFLISAESVALGGATLLSSSFYQRYLAPRDALIETLLSQIMHIPFGARQ